MVWCQCVQINKRLTFVREGRDDSWIIWKKLTANHILISLTFQRNESSKGMNFVQLDWKWKKYFWISAAVDMIAARDSNLKSKLYLTMKFSLSDGPSTIQFRQRFCLKLQNGLWVMKEKVYKSVISLRR